MFEEGFKRYNGVKILKVFAIETQDATITYLTKDSNLPRFAIVREPELEAYTTVDGNGSVIEHKHTEKYQELTESILPEFATALKLGLPVNLVIAVLRKGKNVDFVCRAEFV